MPRRPKRCLTPGPRPKTAVSPRGYAERVDDEAVIERQLGRPARGLAGVAVRCPYGAPAVVEQDSYLPGGEPFPTTYYLTCPHAVAAVSALEDAGGVERYRRLAEADDVLGHSYRDGAERQRSLRRPAPVMLDGGASLALGIGGTARDGAIKCLHAHAAFALAQPGYVLGDAVLAEAAPLFPAGGCCSP
jgi:uncharacterized protein